MRKAPSVIKSVMRSQDVRVEFVYFVIPKSYMNCFFEYAGLGNKNILRMIEVFDDI